MLTPEAKEELEKQQYKIVGEHSAVKICGWTKSRITDQGECYKGTFYGIESHRCLQMTTSISCANRCEFCWRGYKAPVSKEWKWGIDDPEFIINESIEAQRKLLAGFAGNPKVNDEMVKFFSNPLHVALSLTGEPIMYPRFNEICEGFHKRHISTFVVTNAQYPEAIKNLKLCTQLYISVDAPNKELLKEIDKPLFTDFWERLNQSLEYMREKTFRTAIRITAIKGKNMCDEEGWAELVKKGDPDFIEIKSYMWLGASKERLKITNSPTHEETKEWGMKLLKLLPDYEYIDEQISSRVIMLAKKNLNKNTKIDFKNFFEENGFAEDNKVELKKFVMPKREKVRVLNY